MEIPGKISFLVPTIGKREKETRRLLDSLDDQSYKNFEVVIVVQDDFINVKEICAEFKQKLDINIVESMEKGLSLSRNKGLLYCNGDVIVLSDDDCWYPPDAAASIINAFCVNNAEIILSKIYDPETNSEYKSYNSKSQQIRNVFSLLSKSSIEISFLNNKCGIGFDELFGLGSCFVCCEEVDYLIRRFKQGAKIQYVPAVTVFHNKKKTGSDRLQIVAKGALYAKNFNFLTGILVCIKDTVFRHELNFKPFFEGFHKYELYKGKR